MGGKGLSREYVIYLEGCFLRLGVSVPVVKGSFQGVCFWFFFLLNSGCLSTKGKNCMSSCGSCALASGTAPHETLLFLSQMMNRKNLLLDLAEVHCPTKASWAQPWNGLRQAEHALSPTVPVSCCTQCRCNTGAVPGPHLQDQGDKCAPSQSQEVISLLTQALWDAETESRMSLWLSFFTTSASSPEPTREKGRKGPLCLPGCFLQEAPCAPESWMADAAGVQSVPHLETWREAVFLSSAALGYFLFGLFLLSGV